MKQIIIITILCLLTITSAQAQAQPRPMGKKIEQAKIAMLTNKLNLTEQQAIKFWPIYNQYLAELKIIHQKRKAANDVLDNLETISDGEIEKNMDIMILAQEEELNLRKKYRSEFGRVLSIRQVAVLARAEKEFKEMLLKRIGNQQGKMEGPAMRNRRN